MSNIKKSMISVIEFGKTQTQHVPKLIQSVQRTGSVQWTGTIEPTGHDRQRYKRIGLCERIIKREGNVSSKQMQQ